MNATNANNSRGRRKGRRAAITQKSQGYGPRPPVLVPTISKRHIFRYLNGGTAQVTTFTADQLLDIVVVGRSGSTAANAPITSYKLNKVDLYFAPNATVSGFSVAPTLYWEAGSGALTEEGKAVSKVGVTSYQNVGDKLTLRPPKQSTQGMWYNDSSSGDVFTVNSPTGASYVLDIDMDVTFSDAVVPGRAVTLGANAPFTGLLQRGGFTNLTAVGYQSYTP